MSASDLLKRLPDAAEVRRRLCENAQERRALRQLLKLADTMPRQVATQATKAEDGTNS
jgi:hypothetical protein